MTATLTDPFWAAVASSLERAANASTAAELVDAVYSGPDQGSGDSTASAFFAGSGGDDQLVEALSQDWTVKYITGPLHWTARSRVDGSVVVYIEGDLYAADADSRKIEPNR